MIEGIENQISVVRLDYSSESRLIAAAWSMLKDKKALRGSSRNQVDISNRLNPAATMNHSMHIQLYVQIISNTMQQRHDIGTKSFFDAELKQLHAMGRCYYVGINLR